MHVSLTSTRTSRGPAPWGMAVYLPAILLGFFAVVLLALTIIVGTIPAQFCVGSGFDYQCGGPSSELHALAIGLLISATIFAVASVASAGVIWWRNR